MARRTTDLLDVFRERPAPPPRTPSPERSSGPRRSFEGLFLFPRQLLLGSCVVVLLLVFAFVLGLSVGRRGASPTPNLLQAASARSTEPAERPFYALGRVPYVDTARQVRNEPSALRDRLVENYGVDAGQLWIGDDAAAKQWVLILGPFATEQRAMDYLVRQTLLRARLGSGYPFDRPVYKRLQPAELPRQRVPER